MAGEDDDNEDRETRGADVLFARESRTDYPIGIFEELPEEPPILVTDASGNVLDRSFQDFSAADLRDGQIDYGDEVLIVDDAGHPVSVSMMGTAKVPKLAAIHDQQLARFQNQNGARVPGIGG